MTENDQHARRTTRKQVGFMFVMATMFAIPLCLAPLNFAYRSEFISIQEGVHASVAFTLVWYGMVFAPTAVRYLDERNVAGLGGRKNGH